MLATLLTFLPTTSDAMDVVQMDVEEMAPAAAASAMEEEETEREVVGAVPFWGSVYFVYLSKKHDLPLEPPIPPSSPDHACGKLPASAMSHHDWLLRPAAPGTRRRCDSGASTEPPSSPVVSPSLAPSAVAWDACSHHIALGPAAGFGSIAETPEESNLLAQISMLERDLAADRARYQEIQVERKLHYINQGNWETDGIGCLIYLDQTEVLEVLKQKMKAAEAGLQSAKEQLRVMQQGRRYNMNQLLIMNQDEICSCMEC